MKNLTILLSLIIVLFSCKQKREVDNIVDLTSIIEPNVTNLSELGSEITYIPLETKAGSLIKRIDNLIYEDESYFLGSVNRSPLPEDGSPSFARSGNELYRFSKNGKFLCQIGREGRAPSEYTTIKDFFYNESNNTIEIFSGKEINEFSLDGIWKKDITVEYDQLAALGYTNNQFLGFISNSAGQDKYSFVLLDANGQMINRFENKYKFTPAQGIFHPSECIFYRYEGILHCKELHSDTIFSFDDGTFIPKYILKQGEAKYTPELREDEQYIFKNRDKIIIQKNASESTNYLFFQYDWQKRDNFFIQNKSNGTQYLIDNGTGLVNDLDNGPNFKIQNTVTVDGIEYMISWIDAFELKAHVASDEFKNSTPKYPEKKKEFEKLANSLDENDNPVLMLVKLKD
ncbi:6-bladed beta-propeller protein [Tangfeifania diversioriginum]|uniref:6-bladed beta-propeller protein n=1 Tax=Tangfeifania diversioriginum TaxID=1168035 RepID=A0A1M6NTA4_9BACT|nr:6-bladed beta-propeller [Tangfeifania diversioriginum]SHJ98959.1 6-bladed beta-propeller protein [Tangfeifania diversioriginum]